MAQKCPDCGFSNDDAKLFCGACGEPLKGDAKLVRDMERLNQKKAAEAEAKANPPKAVPLEGRKPSTDEDFVHKPRVKKKDNTVGWLIFLALMAFFILCVCGFYVLENADKFF